jgi:hypothetical protein
MYSKKQLLESRQQLLEEERSQVFAVSVWPRSGFSSASAVSWR